MLNLRKNESGKFTNSVYGEKVGLIAKIFGCRHDELSRPFKVERTSYRSCLDCGAKTPFNEKTFETIGDFYYPPLIKAVLEN